MKFNFIIFHYDEIGLKGKNRSFFERKLAENIKNSLDKNVPGSLEYTKRISGRIIAKFTDKGVENRDEIKELMKNIFGLAHFSFAANSKQDIEAMGEIAVEILSGKEFQTFRITAQRSKKEFPMTSREINEQVGGYVLDNFGEGVKVKMKNADAELFIEIVENFAFLYSEKIPGPGGLPSGTGGKAVSLLSGGIDSPVSSFYVMRRGVTAAFLHFHSLPYTSPESVNKIKELAGALKKFQPKIKLCFVPFIKIQKQIMLKCPAKLRVILYRRFMLRIAERIAEREGASALVTGDAVGQVASQTLENIRAIEECVKIPVLRPLIGFDKKEIIAKAKEIGTYDISTLPHEDCCSLFIPERPETKAKLNEVPAAEKELDVEKLIAEAIEETEEENIN